MRRLATIFGAMALLLLSSAILTYLAGLYVLHAGRAAVEQERVIAVLADVLSTLKDAETGERGYLITGEEPYLEPYKFALAHLGENLQEIEALGRQKVLSAEDVAELKRLANQKTAWLSQTIELRRSRGLDAATAAVRSGRSKQIMDEFRALDARLMDREIAELRNLQQHERWATRFRTFTFTALAFLNLIFIAWAYRRIAQEIEKRLAAAAKVAEQKELLAVTLSSIGDAVIVTDPNARINYINSTAQKLTGWTSAEAQGRPLAEVFNIVNEETRRHVESPVAKAIREGVIVGLANHTLLIARDGAEWPIDDSAAPIRDGTKIIGVVMVFHEITERRKAEMATRRSEQRLQMILSSITDGYLLLDAQGRVAEFNDPARGMFREHGVDADGLVGKHLWQEAFPDTGDLPNVRAIARTLGERISTQSENYYQPWQRWIEVRNFPTADGGVATFFKDITERKGQEEALRTSELRYRRLFESAHDGILLLDMKDRKVTDVNPFLLHLLDYPRDWFVGKELWEIGLLKDKEANHKTMQLLEQNGSVRFENLSLDDRNGGQHPVEVVANLYREDHKSVVQCNIRDISERLQGQRDREALLASEQAARMEAQAANRAKDLFLSTLSHELRTPLTAIVGWVRILRQEGCREEDLQEGLAVIERNSNAQVQLIDDVLDVSRIVSGKLRLEMKSCDLVQVVKAGLDVVRPAAAARKITLDTELDPAASRAVCDTVRMQQVIWNLLSNAVKFTPKGGRVSVKLWRERSSIKLQVIDTGQGITSDLLPYVFDRFRQGDSGTRRKFGGLGLGLSIVKHLVEMHGGRVYAESAGEGKGSTFTVVLPIRAVHVDEEPQLPQPAAADESTHEAQSEPQLPVIRLDGLRILVVDDEADARRLLDRVLGAAGATVTAAGSATEAVQLLEKAKPDLLVSDLGMPDQDGYDLIRKVRAKGLTPAKLPAVALTAYAHKDYARRALLAGFQVHVPKPVDPQDLLTVVASICGRTGEIA